jgi:hypothetical protein
VPTSRVAPAARESGHPDTATAPASRAAAWRHTRQAAPPLTGDCESGGRDGERGAAGQSAHAVPMQGAGRGGTWRRGCSGTLAPRAERSFVRLAAEDRACPRSRTARQPSSPAGVCGSQRQIALLALKPKGAGSRSRNSTPLSRIASMCARAVEDLALRFQAWRLVRTAAPAWPTRFAGGSARPRAGAFCGTPPRASTQGDPRKALAPWGARALFRISGRRAGCPSGRPCARSSRPPCRRTGSGRRTRCGPRRCRLASARSS